MDQEQEEYDENSIFAKAAKIETLTDELLHVHDLQGIPPERKEYIHLILGYEPGLSLTYDPSLVEHPNTFIDKIERQFDKEVKKGAAKPIPRQVYQKKPKAVGRAKETKIANYSWIPMSDIHTARTTIDSFVHLSPEERKELHQKFATLVTNLISQFDSIGKVDDNHITADQAASLTASFSKALIEIQNNLFQPIIREHKLKKRGPLFNPKKSFDGRHVHYRTKQTLSDVSKGILKSNHSNRNNNNNNNNDSDESNDSSDNLSDVKVFSKNRETYDKSIFPPQYRPEKKFNAQPMQKESFLQMAQKIRKDLEELDRVKAEEARNKPPPPPPPRPKVEILATPRKVPPTPPRIRTRKDPKKKNSELSNKFRPISSMATPRKIPYSTPATPSAYSHSVFSNDSYQSKKKTIKPNFSNLSNFSTGSSTSKKLDLENPFSSLFESATTPKSKKPSLSYNQIKNPENDFFSKTDLSLKVNDIAGVETGAILEGIDRLFAPMKTKKEVEVKEEIKVGKLLLPDKDTKTEEAHDGHYLFKPKLETVSDLLNAGEFLEIDEKQTSDEHQNLVSLWDQLSLHPDTRLLMAAKLCTLCTDDYNSEYQFKTITSATEVLQKYQACYKKYKHLLKYEPCIASPEMNDTLTEISTDFMLTEASFVQANRNMTQILGTEINTIHGTVEELIHIRSKKIRNLRINAGVEIVKKEEDQQL